MKPFRWAHQAILKFGTPQLVAVALLALSNAAVAVGRGLPVDEGQGIARGAEPRTSLRLAVPQPPISSASQERDSELTVAPRRMSEANPENAASGLNITGAVAVTWGSAGLRIQAGGVENDRAGGTSGTLALQVWATAKPWAQAPPGYVMGTYTLGQLAGGFHFANVDSGFIAYTPPPASCFYVTLVLLEFNNGQFFQVDNVPLVRSDGSGNPLFSFGGVICSAPPPCTADAVTACILNGRFKATVEYRNGFDDQPVDTNALVKPVTGFANPSFETVFFYLNDQSNIEVLLKMLDQGNQDSQGRPTLAVLFGTATPLRIQITITDTKNGQQKVYTSSFTSMQGGTDFAAFVK